MKTELGRKIEAAQKVIQDMAQPYAVTFKMVGYDDEMAVSYGSKVASGRITDNDYLMHPEMFRDRILVPIIDAMVRTYGTPAVGTGIH
jgi:hypothetical protein